MALTDSGYSRAGLSGLFGLALAVVMGLSPAQASQVRPMSLAEITERAATIVTGRCVANRTERDPSLGVDVRVVTLDVDRTLKGVGESAATLRMLGSRAGLSAQPTVPRCRPGEQLLLFLYEPSRLGFTSPVGLGQGQFSIRTDKSGRRIAINGHGNTNLFRGMDTEGGTRVGELIRGAETGAGIELGVLLELVDALRE